MRYNLAYDHSNSCEKAEAVTAEAMSPQAETKTCQNCKQEFQIEPDDFAFYEKIKVPPPTWCPECRMIRRMVFYNQRKLFRRKDDASGKEIFSGIPPQAPVKVYDHDYWWSDNWDPMDYGRDYDFSRPFFEQFRELFFAVPRPSKSAKELVNSEYSNNGAYSKNTYLCFDIGDVENSAYIVRGTTVKESLDLFEAKHSELCYDGYMVDEAFKVFFSVNCEECTDVWFSRNLFGCNNCFGCVNLRNKSYYIFNKPHTKEEYQKFISAFQSGSYGAVEEMRKKARDFWASFPMRFTLAINVQNSTGEHIEHSKNLKFCYSAHESENLGYCQFVFYKATDSYDSTVFGELSLAYESAVCGLESSYGLKWSYECWPACHNLEYAAFCRSSSDLFGCVGVQKKQHCILNKPYSKEDYFALREKIIKQMNEMPYTDKRGRVYKYGEFYPPEFSVLAYNETLAQSFFPLISETAAKAGYLWREPEKRSFEITKKAGDLPDVIKDVDDSILKEILGCASCGGAYRIIPMELQFYRRIPLPLPRLCPECRFRERFKFVNPPKWWHAACQCAGETDDRKIYKNTASHSPHKKNEHCPNEFETSYAPGRPEIVYCEACYQSEVI